MKRIYKITCDGHDTDIVELEPEQYKDQSGRDKVRKEYAERHGISVWGVRLIEIGRKYIMWTDMKTGISHRKYLNGSIETLATSKKV
jgi:hypothetical protein